MRPVLSLALSVALALLPGSGQAGDGLAFRLCTEDVPFWPLLSPDPHSPGDGQILMRMTAEQTGASFTETFAPWRRCQELLDAGAVDALDGASFAAINRAIAAFPLRGKLDDERRALGVVRTHLFRRRGSAVQLREDGFDRLKTRVGIMNSYQLNSLSVARHGGIPDDNSRTMESLARRLVGGELDLIAASDPMLRLCAGPFAGKMEVLPAPLDEAPYYLAFAKAYYAKHRAAVEAFWSAMAEVRQSEAYRQRLLHAARQRARQLGSSRCPVAQ